jgi:predicted O-methyltransferase YrrM
MNFLTDIFNKDYYFKLGKRRNTFQKIFEYTESLNKKNATILETGIARQENNWEGDGMSTLMFDRYINSVGGNFTSIDINPQNVEFARSNVSAKSNLICSDSVIKLHEISRDENFPMIDVLYLDSFDVDFNNPVPSSFHHIKELLAIFPKIQKGTLIVVDDNFNGKGKGQMIKDYMKNIGINPFFDEYQIGFIYE